MTISGTYTYFTKPEKEALFIQKGLYNFATLNHPVRPSDASLLETGMLGRGLEPTFARVMRETIDLAKIPDESNAATLGLFAVALFFRSPFFHKTVSSYAAQKYAGSSDVEVMQHAATLTSIFTIQTAARINHCIFHIVGNSGTARFWTYDAPSWHWSQENGALAPIESVDHLYAAVERKAYLRWICPLSPRFLIEVAFRQCGGQEVRHRRVSDVEVAQFNRLILSRARHVRVFPPQ